MTPRRGRAASPAGPCARRAAGGAPDDVEGTAVDVDADRAAAVIGVEHEPGRRPAATGFTDAVTFAFGDPDARLLRDRAAGARLRPEPAGQRARRPVRGPRAGRRVAERRRPRSTRARLGRRCGSPGLRVRTLEPLRAGGSRSTRRRRAASSSSSRAVSPPAELARTTTRRGSAGWRATSSCAASTRHRRPERRIDGLGQRGHSWGVAGLERIALARTLAAWLSEDGGVAISAVRPAGAEATTTRPSGARCSTRDGRRSGSRAAPLDDLRRRRPPAPRRARAVGRRGGRLPAAAAPARCCADPRSTSGSCGSTARSSRGSWTAARPWGATTWCAASPKARTAH